MCVGVCVWVCCCVSECLSGRTIIIVSFEKERATGDNFSLVLLRCPALNSNHQHNFTTTPNSQEPTHTTPTTQASTPLQTDNRSLNSVRRLMSLSLAIFGESMAWMPPRPSLFRLCKNHSPAHHAQAAHARQTRSLAVHARQAEVGGQATKHKAKKEAARTQAPHTHPTRPYAHHTGGRVERAAVTGEMVRFVVMIEAMGGSQPWESQ